MNWMQGKHGSPEGRIRLFHHFFYLQYLKIYPMNKVWTSYVLSWIIILFPMIGICQSSFSLPDDRDKLELQELYRDQKIKEVKIFKKTIDRFDTTIILADHQFFDEGGNMLEEKHLETKQTLLNFFDQNNVIYRTILFIDDKKNSSTYYYFNRYDRIIVSEIYDRLDSLSITNYFNYIEKKDEIKCIVTTSQGDTTQFEYLRFEEPSTISYQRYAYPDELVCEISYVLNETDLISRRIVNNVLSDSFESWGYAYDENGRRYIGEKYDENREISGTVEFFHDTVGLMRKEIYRDRGGRIQYELLYEYQRY